jgi:uridine phosphorylase
VGDVVCVAVEHTTSLPTLYRKEYRATLSIPLPEVVSNTVLAVGAEPCGAMVENMEGAAVFAVCHHFGVPCGEIRAVSNYVSDSREQWDIPTALNNLARIIKKIY